MFSRITLLLSGFLIVFATLATSFGVTSSAFAYDDPLKDACSGAGAKSVTCKGRDKSGNNPVTGANGTINRVANLVSVIAGMAAIIIIIISGIRYTTSNGDAQAISQAKKAVIGALIGLVVIVFARFIVSLIAKGVS